MTGSAADKYYNKLLGIAVAVIQSYEDFRQRLNTPIVKDDNVEK